MTIYELNKIAREISEKLEKFQANVDWLEADTQTFAKSIKTAQKEKSSGAFAPKTPGTSTSKIRELSQQEFAKQHLEHGEKLLNQRMAKLAKISSPQNNYQIKIDPQQEEIINAFRRGESVEKIIAKFTAKTKT
ncbi:MAG: hypothetical protein RMX96_31215 [Nostoc sp. ChiSLP02]|nr:hypothetical protein [Nostoc sp. DedSLP05]MDZ8102076.1 hypothetical protein [Nostoc sp. DedSLP01]MDZ8189297.1 hypothetical protein [Nostoc sp. ChiSLP02]